MSIVPSSSDFRDMTAVSRTERAVIVVPCYNEAERLDGAAFLGALTMLPHVDFLFVDDGSKDRTREMLTALVKIAPERMSVLELDRNVGKAEAVRQGLRAAIKKGADVTGYWDADLATPLNAIDDMLRVLDRLSSIDVVFGSRRVLMGHAIRRDRSRRFVSKTCNILARAALRMPIGDTQCGAKLFRINSALSRAVKLPFRAGWLFDVELFSRLGRAGAQNADFYEMPLVEWTEIAGSSVSVKAVLRSGLQMLRLIADNHLGTAALK